MTIAFIGDPHIGNFSRFGGVKELGMNERCRLTLATFKRALLTARQEGAQVAVVLGDLFDNMKPEPQLISAVRQVLRAVGKEGLQVILLKGNHDSASDEPGDTALWAVHEPNVYVIDKPRLFRAGSVKLALVPFRSGPVGEWLQPTLNEIGPGDQLQNAVLCLHAGVKDNETAPWLRDAPDAIELETLTALMDEYEISHAFCGNWHEHQVWMESDVHQVGALCPTGFSNLGVGQYGQLALRRNDTQVEYRYIPGPRFLKLGPKESPADLDKDANLYFVEWRVPAHEYDRKKAELDQLIEQGRVRAGAVLPDTSDAREGLAEAARVAKRAVGLEEALEAYIGELALPENLTPEDVKARVRHYLGL